MQKKNEEMRKTAFLEHHSLLSSLIMVYYLKLIDCLAGLGVGFTSPFAALK